MEPDVVVYGYQSTLYARTTGIITAINNFN